MKYSHLVTRLAFVNNSRTFLSRPVAPSRVYELQAGSFSSPLGYVPDTIFLTSLRFLVNCSSVLIASTCQL